MPGPIRTRQSCDRCHSQKLKCPKQPGNAICTRCFRAGTPCVFSPPGSQSGANARWQHGQPETPIAAPQHVLPPTTIDAPGHDAAASFDWSFLDNTPFAFDPTSLNPAFRGGTPSIFGDYLGPTPKQSAGPDNSPSNTVSASEIVEEQALERTTAEDPKMRCSRKLAEILHDLDQAWEAAPERSLLHISQDDKMDELTAALTKKYPNQRLLELIMSSAQRLIDIYPTAIEQALALHAENPAPCNVPNCVHHLALPEHMARFEQHYLSREGSGSIDHVLANLLVSCHLRFVDVLDRIFLMVSCCFRITVASPTHGEPEFDMPMLKVGSFVPGKSAAVFMQAFLMKHFLGALGERAQELANGVASKAEAQGGDTSRECRILKLQCEMLQERHEAKVQQFTVIADEVVKTGMVK